MVGWVGGWVGGWLGGWLENWRVMLISAFNYVIVKVEAELGKKMFSYVYLVPWKRSMGLIVFSPSN